MNQEILGQIGINKFSGFYLFPMVKWITLKDLSTWELKIIIGDKWSLPLWSILLNEKQQEAEQCLLLTPLLYNTRNSLKSLQSSLAA